MNKSFVKTTLPLMMVISKINEKYYVALDGNLLDIADFGIESKFKEIGDAIQETINKILSE